MNKVIFITFLGILASCSSSKESSSGLQEDEMIVTRKYVGNYVDFRKTGIETFSEVNLIWIKTSMDSIYGKFSAYGRNCDFRPDDRLFITRSYYSPGGISGYWIYRIENNSSVSYRLTDVQYDRKILSEKLFRDQ
ncbi:MAG: hypothetical protein MUD02_10145 [Bacteroidales bacterium]|jgi:hypothetical protein|nr:hypothetical protein [Bacteroidales bacterium]